MSSAWAQTPDGIRIAVRVTPRTPRESLGPGGTDHFAARLTAPPVEGAANAALVALVAKHFGVAKRDVRLIAGAAGRFKRLAIAGDGDALAEIARSLYGSRA